MGSEFSYAKLLSILIITMIYYLYILVCSDGSLYTGITNNLIKRFNSHKMGIGSKYVKSRLPFKQVYLEEHATKSSALKRELEIKSWNRLKKITDLKLNLGI